VKDEAEEREEADFESVEGDKERQGEVSEDEVCVYDVIKDIQSQV